MALLHVEDLRKTFAGRNGRPVHAVNGVSLEIAEGQTLGLIGESGSGKSTVGRMILRLLEPDAGSIVFDGAELRALDARELRRMRAKIQIVFQEPYQSLNPRMRVGQIVSEPLALHAPSLSKAEIRARMLRTLESVGLDPQYATRYPRALSGGQQQRVGIARAIVTEPRLVVLDEPTASLDMSVRSQILDLLRDLQRNLGLSYLFISHDLASVEHVSDRIAVMYLGEVRESGPVAEVVQSPCDPYTVALLSAGLSVDPAEQRRPLPLRGDAPTAVALPDACFLYGRCPVSIDACAQGRIELREVTPGHRVRCIRAEAGQVRDRAGRGAPSGRPAVVVCNEDEKERQDHG